MREDQLSKNKLLGSSKNEFHGMRNIVQEQVRTSKKLSKPGSSKKEET